MPRCNVLPCWLLWVCLASAQLAQAEEKLELSPNRPTVANAAAVQGKGILQFEVGYDAYPQTPPGAQQTVDTALYYTPWENARLDFSWSPLSRVQSPDQRATGVGTVQMGTKIVFVKDQTHRWLPGLGLQYEAELPTASDDALNGYGQQAIFLMDRHFGRAHLIVNGSVVQTDCQTKSGCTVGGQQSLALTFKATPHTSLYAETFAQNVSQSNTPPGTYVFGGFQHRLREGISLNGGMRFGVSDHSASIGTTVGLVFGKRLKSAR